MTQTSHSSQRALPTGWGLIKRRLFATKRDAIISLTLLLCAVLFLPPLLRWAIIDAQWAGDPAAGCDRAGACWLFVRVKFQQFIYGFFPAAEHWRVNMTFVVGAAGLTALMVPWKKGSKRSLVLGMLTIYPVFAFFLLYGGVFGLEKVDTAKWGGLMLTLVISSVGIVCSLPLGILLALGRQSSLPVIRALCVGFIELWRGVPLITVLFMASVMLPLFMPKGVDIDKLIRCLVGVSLFSSAYMAEVVRGGLQAVPSGQREAAMALGLSYWKTMRLIVLPQALKKVIPGIVNTFIGLFKDTTLVLIVGMFDLLGIVQAAATDPKWLGYAAEGYVFAGLIYWAFCYGMSRYSQSIERRLQTDQR